MTAYAEEGDLFTHIKRARESNPRRYFPERQVLDWTAQIALALDHIHAMRVMHRDLKTQNIFLGRGGVVKLGDFGISRVLERTDDFATTVAGTPYYLSPEVCQNQPYTLKSDVWSFGALGDEIATPSTRSGGFCCRWCTASPTDARATTPRFRNGTTRGSAAWSRLCFAGTVRNARPSRPRCSRRSCRTTCGACSATGWEGRA